MTKKKFLPALLICSALLIISCATTPAADSEPKSVSDKSVATTKQKEPEVPANIKFASELQKLLNENDIEGAINLFQKIPAELEDDIDLKLLLGALYFSNNQYDEALNIANQVLESDSTNIDALELISMCNRAKGDKNAYKKTTDQILSVDPYNSSVNVQKAEEYALNKKYKLSRDSYKKALRGDPDNEDAIFGYAQMSFYTDDLNTATEYFQKLLDKNPKNAAALAYMGKIAYDGENYLRATKFVQEALKYDPTNYDYWMDYGTYLRYQGKFDDAAKAWTRATELDPSYFLAYAYLAGSYDDLGKWELALENYHKVIETNPKYFYAYESAAVLEYHAKNYKEAIKLFTKAYSYSDNWFYNLMIAACYFKLNDSINAKKILQQQMKKMDQSSTEYSLVRFFNDSYSKNAESTLNQKIGKETNGNKKGKMLFYMGLYCELNKADDAAREYYAKVTNMQAAMFFEYRLAEWGLEK